MRVLSTRLRRPMLVVGAGALIAALTAAAPAGPAQAATAVSVADVVALSTARTAPTTPVDLDALIAAEADRDQARRVAHDAELAADAQRAAAEAARIAAEQAAAEAARIAAEQAAAEAARVAAEQAAAEAEAARGATILAEAEAASGGWYRWGGTSPSGFDCSGYAQYVYRQVGLELPRTSAAQRAATEKISADELEPGDLVFQSRGGRVHHVSIYAGDGMVWEALKSGTRVGLKEMRVSAGTSYGRV